MTETRRIVVSGQVQGVAFRYHMSYEAQQLGVRGWVRNLRDGSVEALISGSPEAVAAMLAWARHGPPSAEVAHVAVELAEVPGNESFEILSSL